jgi:exonuclease III
MKLVAWNGRGLGNRAAERGLLDVKKREILDVLFLSETKLDEQRMQKFRWLLDMPNMAVYNCNGRSGGLALLWKRDVRLYIDANISDGNMVWRFTGVYGDPENKELTWRALRNLKQQGSGPWLLMGDFNEILFQHEKVGGTPKPQAQMDRFREAIEFCELTDLGFMGDIFTWRNHSHRHDHYVKERLDRAVANIEWRYIYPAMKIINGEPRHSDHRPLILDTNCTPVPTPSFDHVFRFEAAWL